MSMYVHHVTTYINKYYIEYSVHTWKHVHSRCWRRTCKTKSTLHPAFKSGRARYAQRQWPLCGVSAVLSSTQVKHIIACLQEKTHPFPRAPDYFACNKPGGSSEETARCTCTVSRQFLAHVPSAVRAGTIEETHVMNVQQQLEQPQD